LKNIIELRKELLTPVFTKKDISISYRALNHYDRKDILLIKRKKDNQWRKFNSIEFIWLNIIIVLREMGLSINKIFLLKKKIFEDGNKGSIDKARFINKSFEDEILFSIINNYELYILIFYDGGYTFHDSISLNQWHSGVYKNEPYINVPLSNLILDVRSNYKNK